MRQRGYSSKNSWKHVHNLQNMYLALHTYIHACMHACMHTYIHTYIHTSIAYWLKCYGRVIWSLCCLALVALQDGAFVEIDSHRVKKLGTSANTVATLLRSNCGFLNLLAVHIGIIFSKGRFSRKSGSLPWSLSALQKRQKRMQQCTQVVCFACATSWEGRTHTHNTHTDLNISSWKNTQRRLDSLLEKSSRQLSLRKVPMSPASLGQRLSKPNLENILPSHSLLLFIVKNLFCDHTWQLYHYRKKINEQMI